MKNPTVPEGGGFVFKALGGAFFSPVVRSSFVVPFLRFLLAFVALGRLLGHFLSLFEFRGLLLDCTHSQAKTDVFRFWSSQADTFSSIFPGVDSGCVFS